MDDTGISASVSADQRLASDITQGALPAEQSVAHEAPATSAAAGDAGEVAAEEGKQDKRAPRKPPRCRYFASKRGCRRGGTCKFRHEERRASDCNGHTKLPRTGAKGKAVVEPDARAGSKARRPRSAGRGPTADSGPTVRDTAPSRTRQRDRVQRPAATLEGEVAALQKLYASSFRLVTLDAGPRREAPAANEGPEITTHGSLGDGSGVAAETSCATSDAASAGRQGAGPEPGKQICLTLVPSDPDWPEYLGICDIPLRLTLPTGYPTSAPPRLTVVSESTEISPPVPAAIAEHINTAVQAKAAVMYGGSGGRPFVRPLLRWLDRGLGGLFVEAAHAERRRREAEAAGFEFLPAVVEDPSAGVAAAAPPTAASYATVRLATLKVSKGERSELEGSRAAAHEAKIAARPSGLAGVHDGVDPQADGESQAPPSTPVDSLTAERRGTEVAVIGLQLGGAGLLYTRKFTCVLTCGRCRQRAELTLKQDGSGRPIPGAVVCSKCSARMAAAFRPAAAHAASHVVGYLDLDGCTAFDAILPTCAFAAECEDCQHTADVGHAALAQEMQVYCRHCHKRMTVLLPRVRFTRVSRGDAPPGLLSQAVAAAPDGSGRPRRPRRQDEGLQPGQPLPSSGTCRHYKKSFRWMRFPCCGRLFPCDVCHDEATMGDHETVLANRMVCGHCSQEQPFGRAPCRACGKSLAASAAGKHFWEGGEGCRDPSRLSKKDPHKRRLLRKQKEQRAKQHAAKVTAAAKKAVKKAKAAATANRAKYDRALAQ